MPSLFDPGGHQARQASFNLRNQRAQVGIQEAQLGLMQQLLGGQSRSGSRTFGPYARSGGGGGLFGNLLGGFGGGGGNPFAEGIENIRQSREAEIDRSFDDRLNTQLARLQDRGLGGSSFALTAAQGNERFKQDAMSGLAGDIGSLQIQGVQAGQQQQQRNLSLLAQMLGQVF